MGGGGDVTSVTVRPISDFKVIGNGKDIMEAQLRIESDEACRLADDLARLTGEDTTTAVMTALRERLERERARSEKMAQLREITADIRAHLTGPVSSNHDWLFDDDGLPR